VKSENSVGSSGVVEIVSDHQESLLAFIDEPAQKIHDLAALDTIEVAGRFVGEEDDRLDDNRPGDGNALLFAAGELLGPVPATMAQSDCLQGSFGEVPRFGARPAGDGQGQEHIFFGAERFEQMEGLEDEPEAVTAQQRAVVFGQPGEIDSGDSN
jgi:hypothetical protein